MKAIFPGSFNPFTIGHLDILQRALRMFGRVVVAIGYNEHKEEAATSASTRLAELRELLKPLKGVEVELYSGLTVEAARRYDCQVMLRGIRNAADAEYERLLADTNRLLAPEIDTLLLPCRPELACISSSMVRELQHNGVDTTPFLPSPADILRQTPADSAAAHDILT